MEFNARYALTGTFAIAVIVALFAFVFWLANSAGFGERTDYRIRFSEPVTGIERGSDVLFNGIKVGEVSALYLDPADPAALVAAISIRADTPIRADTVAGLSHQGLTGAASILLTGGSLDAAPLSEIAVEGGPLLEADPGASRSWTDAAARVLGRFDDLIGRNSDRFDTILSGLERLAGGGSDAADRTVFDLPAPSQVAVAAQPPDVVLVVAEPVIPLVLNTDKLVIRAGDGSYTLMDTARWPDNLPNLLQARLLQAYENAGYGQIAVRPADAFDPDFRLVLDIRGFHLADKSGGDTADQDPYLAEGDFTAKLFDATGKVVATRQFRLSRQAASRTPEDGVEALRAVFSGFAEELVGWSISAL